eukprot:3902108-Rhodomonas_salina.1
MPRCKRGIRHGAGDCAPRACELPAPEPQRSHASRCQSPIDPRGVVKCGRGHEFEATVSHVTRPGHGVVPAETGAVPAVCGDCRAGHDSACWICTRRLPQSSRMRRRKIDPWVLCCPRAISRIGFVCKECEHSWEAKTKTRRGTGGAVEVAAVVRTAGGSGGGLGAEAQ